MVRVMLCTYRQFFEVIRKYGLAFFDFLQEFLIIEAVSQKCLHLGVIWLAGCGFRTPAQNISWIVVVN